MKVLESLTELQAARQSINLKVGFVPTMGALHDGHLSLMKIAQAKADLVFASIFVNPTQFGPGEDLGKYPRTLDEDIEKLSGLADYIYVPRVEDIYPVGYTTSIHVEEESKGLEGDYRPGHFDGVATVVNILFNQVRPHVAVFGEKDWQQLMVIKRMVYDLDLKIEILSAPTLREPDGLAMSSRNIYLSQEERKLAPKIFELMTRLKDAEKVQTELTKLGFQVDYVAKRWNRLLTAARIGTTRLIDNIAL
jgi:pantoate--beta-alanine ligase